jgi:hypothetical protein
MSHLKFIAVVEDAFKQIGINPEEAKTALPGAWSFRRGSAIIKVLLSTSPGAKNEQKTISMMSRIMEMPAKSHKELFKKLLELNHSFVNERFEIFDGAIFLTCCRHLEGIDAEEVAIMMSDLSETADLLDDKLIREFRTKIN